MAKLALTPALIRATTCPAGSKKTDLFDMHCKGLVLEVRATGGKTFYHRYVDQRGKTRTAKVADEADVTLAQARSLVEKRRNELAMGVDPLQKKATLKSVLTVSEFIHQKYLPHAQLHKRSWKTDECLLRNHIEPRWCKRYLDEITLEDFTDLITLHRKTHAPGSCNRLIVLTRFMFNQALRWNMAGIKSNPTKGFPQFKEDNKKERFLSAEEAGRLLQSLVHSDNPMLAPIVTMLLVTGARKREVLDARWEDFDLNTRSWRIPLAKGGKTRHVPLSDGALQVLSALPRRPGCPWAFANPKTQKPFVSFFCSWNTARKQVGMPELRIHDLRHSFASFLVNNGLSLYVVQTMLGHTQVKTTQRYSHLDQDTLLGASNVVSQCIALQMPPMLLAPNDSSMVLEPIRA